MASLAPTRSACQIAAFLETATNAHRRKRGLRALQHSVGLTIAALRHSARMRNHGFFAHVDLLDNSDALDRANSVEPLGWMLVGENLAAGFTDPDEIVAGWLGSPGHKRNLENADISHIGTALILGGRMGAYATQLYGTPTPTPAALVKHRQIRCLYASR